MGFIMRGFVTDDELRDKHRHRTRRVKRQLVPDCNRSMVAGFVSVRLLGHMVNPISDCRFKYINVYIF
jgi:hypothetical protein